MGILVSKDEEKSKLQERIDADLRTRIQQTSEPADKDFAEDSEYVKELQKTSKYSWVWFILIVLALASLVFIFLL